MDQISGMPEAKFYERIPGGSSVRCVLCPHFCTIPDGHAGRCRVRVNSGGVLRAASYGIVSSLALDPVEKKPLIDFFPGSFILSAGSYGCNLSCRFCQNHAISQIGVPDDPSSDQRYTPAELVAAAKDCVPRGNIGLAFTYNEPFINWEFVHDTAVLARETSLKNVLVTNGFVNPGPLDELLPFVDAMNIDLKAFTDSFYRKICSGSLEPALATIAASASRCHVEIATLVIPGHNSAPAEISALAAWLSSVSPDIVLHLNRHHPDYRMREPAPVSRDELSALADIARRHLSHVRCGNV
jgi:pyruvate formate lyase activating enzyme